MQLEIEGIGQQKATLADWKRENDVYTHYSEYMECEDGPAWSCWDQIESPIEFGEKYSFDAIGVGSTEKEAIIKFCSENEIKLPFWW